MATNPNPQPWNFAAYESPRLTVTMSPAESISGWTFSLNIRNKSGTLLLAVTTVTATDTPNGVFYFQLTSAQTGTTLGAGDYLYDVWRTNSGSEKRLVYGDLSVDVEQWQ